jgi:acyl-CoA reductase-like NAD-dependent aldehyde dehydrogenase
LDLLDHKPEVMSHLQAQASEAFVPWVLREWRRSSIPQWRKILAEAREEGDQDRAEYARWMLLDVLAAPPEDSDDGR